MKYQVTDHTTPVCDTSASHRNRTFSGADDNDIESESP